MRHQFIIAILALFLGIFIGWQATELPIGRNGIQWKLNDAARRGDLAAMKRLISDGADPLAYPSSANGVFYGTTPLFAAASQAEPDVVKFLITLGADVNLIEATETPLDMAEYRLEQAEKTIEILKAHGAENLFGPSSP